MNMIFNAPTTDSFLPVKGTGRALQVLIVLVTSLTVIDTICGATKEQFASENLSNIAALISILGNLAYMLLLPLNIVTALFFVTWMRKALRNLPALNALGAKNKDWYCWGFLIPIVNLLVPMIILQEVWKGSNPAILDSQGWKVGTASRQIYACWICWLACPAIRVLSQLLPIDPLVAQLMNLLSTGFFVAAAILAIVILGVIAIRQENKRNLCLSVSE